MALKRSEEEVKKRGWEREEDSAGSGSEAKKKQVYMHPGQFSFFPILSTLFCDPFHLFP